MNALWAIAMVGPWFIAGCTPVSSWLMSVSGKKSQMTAAERPEVSNAFAYARYLALNIRGTSSPLPWTEDLIQSELIAGAVRSGLPPAEILSVYSRTVFSASQAQKMEPQQGQGQTFRRIELFRQQQQECSQSAVRSSIQCCEAMAWPMAVLPEWTTLNEQQQSALRAAAGMSTSAALTSQSHPVPREPDQIAAVLATWSQFGTISANPTNDELKSRFRTQGMKAWLTVCHSILTQQPETLDDFKKSQWYSKDTAIHWTSVLHAKSRAKRGPRRIYNRSDGLVSRAETLKPSDCSILETEIIVRRPDGALNFWVYDAAGKRTDLSHFPPPKEEAGRGETIEKPSPDSCMGCHYDLKLRTFDVLFPSAAELNLPSTQSIPVRCEKAGERLIDDN